MSKNISITHNEIQQAIDCLNAIFTDNTFPVSIMIETSEDEAILVGTIDSYIDLTIKLLQTINKISTTGVGKVKLDKFETHIVPLESAFNSVGHIVPSSLCLAKNDDIGREIVKLFQNLSP